MKKFFDSLSNKNKMKILKRRENIIVVLMMLITVISSVVVASSIVASSNILLAQLTLMLVTGICFTNVDNFEKKYIKDVRKNYSKELSNKYYLENRDEIDIKKQLMCINIFSRVRWCVTAADMLSAIVLGGTYVYFMLQNFAVAASVWGIIFGKTFILSNILDEIDFRNKSMIRVVEMKKSNVADVDLVDDEEMDAIISRRTDFLSKDSYVPRPSQGMKVSRVNLREATCVWNGYLDCYGDEQETRRGPVRARRQRNERN